MSRLLHIVMVLLQMLMLSQFPAAARDTPSVAPTDAQLTEAHGDVYKRAFVDWTREALGDPSPASVGEILHEGMQIGTGEKSWAQVQWRHMSARAWENSVYAISPNQRLVYLISGEMLYQLDKKRKDKSPYFVWTNLLQARIRGTTVLFQATRSVSRITVLEGTVEVLNKVDRSIVTLTPGVVYEITAKNQDTTQTPINLTNISLESSKPVPIFETSKTVASASAIDPAGTLSHPLLHELESPLASLPLVTDVLTGLQTRLEHAGKNLTGVVTGLLHDSLTITTVPRSLSYTIGSELKNVAQIAPGTFDFFQPEGLIGGAVNTLGLTPTAALTGAPVNVLTDPHAATAGITTGITNVTNVATGAASALPTVLPSTLGTTLNTTATVGRGIVTPVTSTLSNTVTGTVNTVNGILPGASGLTNTVGNTLGGTINTVGNTLNNTLNGLGGLFGH